MRAVFVDTSAWDALEDSSDSNHAVAVRYRTILRQERMPLYVTNFVLDECLTLLLQNVGYVRTVAFKRTIDRMQTGGVLVAVHVSAEIEHAAAVPQLSQGHILALCLQRPSAASAD